MPKGSFQKKSSDRIFFLLLVDKAVHAFSFGFRPKVTIIAQLGFELTHF